jgi:hypothetical protein
MVGVCEADGTVFSVLGRTVRVTVSATPCMDHPLFVFSKSSWKNRPKSQKIAWKRKKYTGQNTPQSSETTEPKTGT